ncbi:hypothetical protein [Vulgatibacter incomptus]|uniref:Uncharacterized protein n=1 Tax=Vulgatibacter incomptus TaxID=1391653 RepID=A0A0K1PHE1_9BACT|nr:hypothetical protein [Vulgatibacter incomptus]AKU92816.1 hypothetical protein AKJ08_3203 [Vulgatibacter incomptus]
MRIRHWLAIGGLIALVTVAGAVFIVKYGAENVIGSGQAFVEKTAVSTLRTLHWAQGLFRERAWLDQDGNGVAEFGTMGQLAGRDRLPSGEVLPNSLVPSAGTRVTGEILEAGGYCFRYDLPDSTHDRERRFIAYAWPRLLDAGRKIYCIDQDEQIYETKNPEGIFGCDGPGPAVGSCPTGDPPAGWIRWKNKTNKLSVGAAP